jgi:hypothetical protein
VKNNSLNIDSKMKYSNAIGLFIFLCILVSCSSDWLKNVENSIQEIDEIAILEKEMDSINKHFTTRIRKFKTGTDLKIQAYFEFNDTLQINTVYYTKKDLII